MIDKSFTHNKNTMLKIQLPIKSERIVFSKISAVFVLDIFAEYTEKVAEFMDISAYKSIDDIIIRSQYLQSQNEQGNYIHLVMTLKSGEFIGCLGLCEVNTFIPRIYIWLKESAQNMGYGSEAVTQMRDIILANKEVKYLNYPVDRRNAPSLKLAKKLGGRLSAQYGRTSDNQKLLHVEEYRFFRDGE